MVKPIYAIAIVLILASCATSYQPAIEIEKYSLQVDDTQRTYALFSPTTDSRLQKIPLVIMFHGAGGSGRQMSQAIHFNDLAQKEGLAVAYPDALVSNWAEGCDCNNADRLNIQDIEFTKAIIDDIGKKLPIDNKRIYAVGYSQGGLFAGRLACELSDTFKAIMIVAANMSVPLSQKCNPAQSIPIQIMQGTDDTVLNYNGTDNGDLSLLSAKETARFWAEKNNLPNDPVRTFLPGNENRKIEVLRYATNDGRFEQVVLLSVINGRHEWPANQSVNANQELIKWIHQN